MDNIDYDNYIIEEFENKILNDTLSLEQIIESIVNKLSWDEEREDG